MNLNDVANEMCDVIDNIKAVKGEQYGKTLEAVHAVLTLLAMATDDAVPVLVKEPLATQVAGHAISRIAELVGMSEEEIVEIMDQSKTLDIMTDRLAVQLNQLQ